jgi:hypothetical protein
MRGIKKKLIGILSVGAMLMFTIGFGGCDIASQLPGGFGGGSNIFNSSETQECKHDFSAWVATEEYLVSEATCTAAAEYYVSCWHCGEASEETFRNGDPLDHVLVETEEIQPTCTEAGQTSEIYCEVCQEVIQESEIIEPLNHVGGQATCLQKAVCDICYEEYGELDPKMHTGDIKWFKLVNTHYQGYTCCGGYETEEEPHNKQEGICNTCGYNPTMEMTSVYVHAGESQIQVIVSVIDNPGIIGLEMVVTYDENVMTLKTAESGDAVKDLEFTSADSLKSGCKFLWDGLEVANQDIQNGTILIMTFDISETAPKGMYSILMKVKGYDSNLTALTFKLINGVVTVE